MSVTHDSINDLWIFQYAPNAPDPTEHMEAPPDGDFTVMCYVAMAALPPSGGLGLVFRKSGEDQFTFTLRTAPLDVPEASEVQGPAPPQWLKIEYYEDTAHLAYGFDNLWADLDPIPIERPDQVGILMTVDEHSGPLQGLISEYRLLPDRYTTSTTEVEVAPMQVVGITPFGAPVATSEALVHGLVGAQFGDLEFDVGKSVRWSQWFVDDLLVTDINTGTQRYWVVNWALTFPEAFHGVTDKNFFVDPVGFRKIQFQMAAERLILDDSDWVLFVDAHEGMSVDSRSLPDDYLIEPFRSFIYREIARAEALSRDRVVIPFFVFLRHGLIQNVSWVDSSTPNTPPVVQALGVPYYIPYLGLTRLVRVSALRHPSFDWRSIDQPTAIVDLAVKIQLVSYGYAHWNMQDIPPGETTVPPLSASNDDGWRMRSMLSKMRPLLTLPYGEPWQQPSADPAGEVGPWAAAFPGMAPANLNIPTPPPAPSTATQGVLAPLYHTVFRINLRDGVWYDEGQSGNIPLAWDGTKWVPTEDPEGVGLVKITVFTIEHVLAHGEDLRKVTATKLAKPLYDAMRSQFNTIALTSADQEIARWWLKRERLHNWSMVSSWPQDALSYQSWRIDQVRFFLSDGWEVGLYIDADEAVLDHVADLGVATLQMSYPAKAVGWKDPEMSAPRSWEVLAATVEGTHQEADDGTG